MEISLFPRSVTTTTLKDPKINYVNVLCVGIIDE